MMRNTRAKSLKIAGYVVLLCAAPIVCSLLLSAARASEKPGKDFGRIAAIVGARQAVGDKADWKLIDYDKKHLRLVGATFKPDRNGDGLGTKLFVFMPLSVGESQALLEFKEGDSLKGKLNVIVVVGKYDVKVTTEEVKKGK